MSCFRRTSILPRFAPPAKSLGGSADGELGHDQMALRCPDFRLRRTNIVVTLLFPLCTYLIFRTLFSVCVPCKTTTGKILQSISCVITGEWDSVTSSAVSASVHLIPV